ncbi:MAG: hypothetical protein R6V58_07095 [Planctomycetota bacterium]
MDGLYRGRLDVAQQSPEYAAALLDANQKIDRATATRGRAARSRSPITRPARARSCSTRRT